MAAPKEIARRLVDAAWNAGDMSVIDEVVAPDYEGHDPLAGTLRGAAALKEYVGALRAAFPDLKLTIHEQVGEGAIVATRWTLRGTHEGELVGVAPTGLQATVAGSTFTKIESGRVVSEHSSWDALGLLQQLGIVREPAPAET